MPCGTRFTKSGQEPNVRENNRAAIRVDEQLGFQTRCHSYEAIAAR